MPSPTELVKITPVPFRTTSLPSGSPRSSPPASLRGGRTVSWNIPVTRMSTIAVVPTVVRYPQQETKPVDDAQDPNSEEYLAWRRLQLSRAKLSGITEMAALMAGFSVVATVELQINDDANPMLLAAFTVTTALLVCTTMMAIMISTCILPHVEVVAEMQSLFAKPHESPHDRMQRYIDVSWVLANSVSIFLFTLDVIILCWIKFTYFSETASWCATIIMIPVLLGVCFFGVVFYRKIVKHQSIISDRKYQELEEMKKVLDARDSVLTV
ncbi:unnamed protein product [Allacma fusca]|uniref:Calcium release-activated calcium channel protein 1 n=1 Tax=Allacma fusca TaxID=39272 RepID=A0A8J2KJS0_9HEXA|nr:unnamed protein product [Allacma fusca]